MVFRYCSSSEPKQEPSHFILSIPSYITLVQGLIISYLNDFNSLLTGLAATTFSPNTAASDSV